MRPIWIVALASIGCRGVLGIEEPIVIDAAAPPDAPASCATWQPHGMDSCAYPPAAPLVLSGQTYTYDTTTGGGTLTGPTGAVLTSAYTFAPGDGPAVAVLSIDALTLGADTTLRVIGAKPLVVLAWSALTIDGTLDASSARVAGAIRLGAGANEDCVDASGRPGQNASANAGSGGGGGGGFQGVGGLGGVGGGPMLSGGGAGGAMIAPVLRGGCPGGASGQAGPIAQTPATVAAGGAGGGALRLLSLGTIHVGAAGAVRASGGGGAGAPETSSCGGGGGGAGGYLGFEAPTVQLDGVVVAIGGGGGGGGGSAVADAGKDGVDGGAGGGASASGCGRAGGTGLGPGLDGGTGQGYVSCATSGGGGGGGGGAGYVVVVSAALTMPGTITPPITKL